MQHSAIFAAIVLALTASRATADEHLPLPAALVSAKTAAVVNGGVTQDVYEQLVFGLCDWKRFTLVDDPAQADVTITIGRERALIANGIVPLNSATMYQLTVSHGETVLYLDEIRGRGWNTKDWVKAILKRLDKRLKEQTPRSAPKP